MGVRHVNNGSHCLKLTRRFSLVSCAMLLLCLMSMVCSCDMLDSQKEQKPAEAPVKMPLPQHGGQPPAGNVPAVRPDNKNAVQAAGSTTKPAQVAGPVTTPAAKPNAKKVDVGSPNAKTTLPARSDNKGQKPTIVAKNETKSIQQTKKVPPVAVEKKAAPVIAKTKTNTTSVIKKQEEKEKSVVPSAKKKAHPMIVGTSSRNWTVVAGPYLLEETLAADLAKVSKTGFAASVQPGIRKKSVMHRLFLAQFDDRAAAQGELEKLKKVTSDAFILDHGGKHTVYAGSYLLDSRAESEKERLAAAGFALTIKRADVAIPSKRLIIGAYRDKAAAEAAAKKLKNAGLKEVRIHQ